MTRKLYLFILFSSSLFHLKGATITVGPNQMTKTIQQALALANSGDTIFVKPGVYAEGNILITKSVVLIGESKPTIDGKNKFEIFSVRAHKVVISGFQIINSGTSSMQDLAGVGVEDANDVVVMNNIFYNTFFGIHLSNSNRAIIENNELRSVIREDYQTGNGIHLWKCANASIVDNRIFHHRDGIYFEFVTDSRIVGNLSEQNLRYGLHFMFSHHDQYTRNIFRNNGAGVAVMYTNFVEMFDNVFEDNWGAASYGLLLKDISDSFIEGNTFQRNTLGILLEGVNRSSFIKNSFKNNGWAVKLQANSESNAFTENNFQNNTFDIVTNGSLQLNSFQRNYWDRYQGYDLNKDGLGDVPYRPVSMYAMVIDRIPTAVMLWRSFLVYLLDKAEKVVPAVTPENLKDDYPKMRPHDFNKAD
jgi:nitrous oxidase accessory protein